MKIPFLNRIFYSRKENQFAFRELEKILGYIFRDKQLLVTALSHRSWVHTRKGPELPCSNERFEFLGDSVLNLIITDILFHKYPQRQEGRLSKMKSLVVSSRVLSKCAKMWKLGDFVLLSRAEDKSGGRKRSSILADAYEAVLGAVYLDGGLDPARKLVERSLVKIMEDVLADEDLVNYKSKLLEYSQAKGYGVPRYQVVEESGPEHKKSFVIGVYLKKQEWGRGKGFSKKISEQSAARQALETLSKLDKQSSVIVQ